VALVHHHLVLSAKVANPPTTFKQGREWLAALVQQLDMQILAPATGAYCSIAGNRGLTVLIPITTSHITMHTWDEQDPARIELDVYSCKPFDVRTILHHLAPLQASNICYKFFDRNGL